MISNVVALFGGPFATSRLLPFVSAVTDPQEDLPLAEAAPTPAVEASDVVEDPPSAEETPAEELFALPTEEDLAKVGGASPRDGLDFTGRAGSTRTLTQQFLGTHWATLRPTLVSHIHHKLPQTRNLGTAEDHVGGFSIKLLASDYLARYIQAGHKVRVSVLKVWAYQFACSEMRGWGTDASLRETRGATTVSDRKGGPPKGHQFATARVIRQFEDGQETGSDITDTALQTPEEATVSRETLLRCHAELRRAFQPEVAESYARLLSLECENMSRRDMALTLGCDESKVAQMLLQMRKVLRPTLAAS